MRSKMVITSTPSASNCSTCSRYGSTVDGVRGGWGRRSQTRGQLRRVRQWLHRIEVTCRRRQLRVLLHGHPRQAEIVGNRALARASTQAMDQFAKIMHV